MTVSKTTPVEMQRGDDLPQFKNLVDFLKILEKHGFLDKFASKSKVIYVDDQFSNLHSVMRHFKEMRLNNKLTTFNNG